MPGPLSGVRVLDLTRVLAGPYTTMLLADMGAEVVKIEEPNNGDESRKFDPFVNGVSTYFLGINRGKKGMTLNLKKEAGKRLFLELIGQADVVVENYRPGVMKKLGLDYPTLRARHPQLVYAACSGFGHSGPYSERGAYDMIVQGMGGMMSITGELGGSPVRVGAPIGDIGAALFTTIGILAAICHARATGQGQMVDVAMLDCQVAMLENAIMRTLVTGEVPGPLGTRHPSIAPFQTVDKVVKDPQVLAREMLVDVQDPKAGPVTVAGFPIKLSATPGKAQGPAPGLGEHTEAVLADWLHISADAVARLREEGVV